VLHDLLSPVRLDFCAKIILSEFGTIREKIGNTECDPALRGDLERLIEHAEILHSQLELELEMVERANRLESLGKNPDSMKM